MRIVPNDVPKPDAPAVVMNSNKRKPEEEYLMLEDQGLLYNQQTEATNQTGA